MYKVRDDKSLREENILLSTLKGRGREQGRVGGRERGRNLILKNHGLILYLKKTWPYPFDLQGFSMIFPPCKSFRLITFECFFFSIFWFLIFIAMFLLLLKSLVKMTVKKGVTYNSLSYRMYQYIVKRQNAICWAKLSLQPIFYKIIYWT